VPHRQFVFTVPKRLRIFFRFDRRLLGELPRLAFKRVLEVYRAVLDRHDVVPGMVAGVLARLALAALRAAGPSTRLVNSSIGILIYTRS